MSYPQSGLRNSFWTVSLDLDAMFKIKSLLYKDLILNSRGCRKSNQLLRHPLVSLTGSQWFQTVSSFSLEKLEAKKCTRMYASGQAIFERLTERLNSSIYYSARFNNT